MAIKGALTVLVAAGALGFVLVSYEWSATSASRGTILPPDRMDDPEHDPVSAAAHRAGHVVLGAGPGRGEAALMAQLEQARIDTRSLQKGTDELAVQLKAATTEQQKAQDAVAAAAVQDSASQHKIAALEKRANAAENAAAKLAAAAATKGPGAADAPDAPAMADAAPDTPAAALDPPAAVPGVDDAAGGAGVAGESLIRQTQKKLMAEKRASDAFDPTGAGVPHWHDTAGYFSLTTIPNRLHRPEFKRCIDSLLSIHPSWPIYLSVPTQSNEPGEFGEVDWITEYKSAAHGRFHVIRTREYGPATKLLGLVAHLGDRLKPDDMIVTVDDDRFYRDDVARALIQNALRYPDSIVAHAGKVAVFRSGSIAADMKYGIWNAPPEPIGAEYSAAGFVNRLQGCGAVLYRRRMIDDEWFHPEAHGTACVYEDDTWFSMMAYFRKIPIFLPGCANRCANPHVGPRQGDGLSDTRMHAGPRHAPPTRKTRECEDAVLANKTVVLEPLYRGGPARTQLRFIDVPPAGS